MKKTNVALKTERASARRRAFSSKLASPRFTLLSWNSERWMSLLWSWFGPGAERGGRRFGQWRWAWARRWWR